MFCCSAIVDTFVVVLAVILSETVEGKILSGQKTIPYTKEKVVSWCRQNILLKLTAEDSPNRARCLNQWKRSSYSR
jgi:hypothetical protein